MSLVQKSVSPHSRRIEEERLERCGRVAAGRRYAVDDSLQNLLDALSGLRRYRNDVSGVYTERRLHLLCDELGLGSGQVDLKERIEQPRFTCLGGDTAPCSAPG